VITSKDMVRRISKRTALPQATVSAVMTAFADEFQVAMEVAEPITLFRIGKFRRMCFRAEGRRHPTGRQLREKIVNGVRFKSSRTLRNRLSRGMEIFDEVEGSN